MRSLFFIGTGILVFLSSTLLYSQLPPTLSYQGMLTGNGGDVVDDGLYELHFKLYNGADPSTALWAETQNVAVVNGIFNAILGSVNPMELPFDEQYYLGIAIDNEDELSPRIALTSSAYSFRTRSIDDGQVVKSINEMKDDVILEGGENVTISSEENRIVISAIHNAESGDVLWQKIGENVYNTNTGKVGIGIENGFASGKLTIMNSDEDILFGLVVDQSGAGTEAAISGTGGYTGVFGGAGYDRGGITSGVKGTSVSESGRGVYGLAAHASGNNFGVYGQSQSSSGSGVYGLTTAATGKTFGLFGESHSDDGVGVYGRATTTATSGNSYGVVGYSESSSSNGVFGYAVALTGFTTGVRGTTLSSSGTGVTGQAANTSGITRGVFGQVNSPDGYAGYFQGGRNYFQGYVGIGKTMPEATLHLNTSNWIQAILENVDDNARGYIGLDWRALTLSNNAFWTGSSWSFPAENEAAFAILFHRSNQHMEFRVRPGGGSLTTAMIINTEENVGIGTLTPGAFRLAVNGNAAKPGGGSWSNFSDKRLKKNIKPIESGIIDELLTLRGYTFEYLDHAIENRLALPGRQVGLIAQEVMEVFPEWVDTDDEGYLYITERGTTALFIEALRELRIEKNSEIYELQKRIEYLEQLVLQQAAVNSGSEN
jgi:hypothetical protein